MVGGRFAAGLCLRVNLELGMESNLCRTIRIFSGLGFGTCDRSKVFYILVG